MGVDLSLDDEFAHDPGKVKGLLNDTNIEIAVVIKW